MITFPSETIPEIDWENPIASKLGIMAMVKDGAIYKESSITLYQSAGLSYSTDEGFENVTFDTQAKRMYSTTDLFTKDNWTIVTRMKVGAATSGGFLFGQHDAGGAIDGGYNWALNQSSNGSISFYVRNPTTGPVDSLGSTVTMAVGTYYDITIRRDGSTFYLKVGDAAEVSRTSAMAINTAYDFKMFTHWSLSQTATGSFSYFYAFTETLTLDEAQSISADPYQILKTTTDELGDYGLTFDGVDSYVTAPNLVLGADFKITADITTGAVTGFQNIVNQWDYAAGKRQFLLLTEGNKVRGAFSHNGTTAYINNGSTLLVVANTRYLLKLEKIGTVLTIQIDEGTPETKTVNVAEHFTDLSPLMLLGESVALNSPLKHQVHSIDFQSTTYPENNRYYDFNRTSGTIVPELINGQNGTLVGFPADSGYVIENEEIIGYEFNGVDTYATIPPLVSANVSGISWDLEFTSRTSILLSYTLLAQPDDLNDGILLEINGDVRYKYAGTSATWVGARLSDDDVLRFEMRWDGAGDKNMQLFVNEVPKAIIVLTLASPSAYTTFSRLDIYYSPILLSYVKYTDNKNYVNNRLYDFTLGDDDQIIDTIGGNHATIVNAKTSGWMPIVEKQVFTIGAVGKDYSSVDAAILAEKNAGNYISKELLISGVLVGSIAESYEEYNTNIVLKGITPWLDKSQKPINGIQGHIRLTGDLAAIGNTQYFKDLLIENTGGYPLSSQQYQKSVNYDIQDCYVAGSGIFDLRNGSSFVTMKISRSICQTTTRGFEGGGVYGDVILIDNIFIYGSANTTYISLFHGSALGSLIIQNCIVKDESTGGGSNKSMFSVSGAYDNLVIDGLITNKLAGNLDRNDTLTALQESWITTGVNFTGAFVDG